MPPPPREAFTDDDCEGAKSSYVRMLAKFLRSFHSDDLRRILLHSDPTLHFPLVIE
jgi:hypothetical protein